MTNVKYRYTFTDDLGDEIQIRFVIADTSPLPVGYATEDLPDDFFIDPAAFVLKSGFDTLPIGHAVNSELSVKINLKSVSAGMRNALISLIDINANVSPVGREITIFGDVDLNSLLFGITPSTNQFEFVRYVYGTADDGTNVIVATIVRTLPNVIIGVHTCTSSYWDITDAGTGNPDDNFWSYKTTTVEFDTNVPTVFATFGNYWEILRNGNVIFGGMQKLNPGYELKYDLQAGRVELKITLLSIERAILERITMLEIANEEYLEGATPTQIPILGQVFAKIAEKATEEFTAIAREPRQIEFSTPPTNIITENFPNVAARQCDLYRVRLSTIASDTDRFGNTFDAYLAYCELTFLQSVATYTASGNIILHRRNVFQGTTRQISNDELRGDYTQKQGEMRVSQASAEFKDAEIKPITFVNFNSDREGEFSIRSIFFGQESTYASNVAERNFRFLSGDNSRNAPNLVPTMAGGAAQAAFFAFSRNGVGTINFEAQDVKANEIGNLISTNIFGDNETVGVLVSVEENLVTRVSKCVAVTY